MTQGHFHGKKKKNWKICIISIIIFVDDLFEWGALLKMIGLRMHNFHKKIYHLFSVTIYGWHSKYSFSMLVAAAAVEVNMYYRRKTGSQFCLKYAKIKILGFKKNTHKLLKNNFT